jgi:hypothetical protein
MIPLQWPSKDPDEVLDYEIDWSSRLGADTILVSTWSIPSGLTAGSSTNTSTKATVWLSGGTANTQYTITNRIVTTAGRGHDQQVSILIEGNGHGSTTDPSEPQWYGPPLTPPQQEQARERIGATGRPVYGGEIVFTTPGVHTWDRAPGCVAVEVETVGGGAGSGGIAAAPARRRRRALLLQLPVQPERQAQRTLYGCLAIKAA